MKNTCSFHKPLQVWYYLGLFFLLLGTASCVAAPIGTTWNYADLRAINSQVAPTPATDILAVYTRTIDLSVDIRIDLLDINPNDKYILKLALWDNREFSQNPLRIEITSASNVQISGIPAGMPAIWPHVIQDYSLDTITVSLNRFFIGERYRLDISTYTTDPGGLADEVLNVRSDGQPPLNRAPALIAFWDTFPATTPAQALRRWNGAHTGPLGDRHGLIHILDGAWEYGIPVALLDIKTPSSLASLDFMGNIPELKSLYDHSLLILPDVAYGEPADVTLDLSRRATAGFGLPSSQFVYATSLDLTTIPGYRAWFLPLADRSHLESSGGTRLIPLPPADSVEATEDGPSLDVRRSLINVASSPDPTDLVVLGGSLPDSTWGDSDMAYPTYEWIAAHPWIQPLSAQDLLTFPTQTRQVPPPSASKNSAWLEALRSAPQNSITQSAWQTYLMLTYPTTDTRLEDLGSAYLGQIGELLEAATWAQNQTPRIDCNQDLNSDGHNECILANQKFFAVLETAGARLTQFFYVDKNGPHQLIGPSSQFAIGLSDPSEWHLEKGEAADPSVIPGAFTDDANTWANYTPHIQSDGIAFSSPDTGLVKTYRLLENGIQVLYQPNTPVSTRIPLALDPQAFYYSRMKYEATLVPHLYTWSLSNGRRVEISTDAALSANDFTAAIPFLSEPEDPNLEYPKGNYLPFPLSVVTIRSNAAFSVKIIQK